jgi:metal-sulfur cluster biosynthetic enzyme
MNAVEAACRQALYEVYDPELGLNVADLGLVYDLRADEAGIVHVTMTLTTQSCPVGPMILEQVQERLQALAPEVRIALTFDPPWSPERISEAGRAFLDRR